MSSFLQNTPPAPSFLSPLPSHELSRSLLCPECFGCQTSFITINIRSGSASLWLSGSLWQLQWDPYGVNPHPHPKTLTKFSFNLPPTKRRNWKAGVTVVGGESAVFRTNRFSVSPEEAWRCDFQGSLCCGIKWNHYFWILPAHVSDSHLQLICWL